MRRGLLGVALVTAWVSWTAAREAPAGAAPGAKPAAVPAAKHPAPARASKPPPRSMRGYAEMVKGWHMPSSRPCPATAAGRPMLVLEMINTGERVELRPEQDGGAFPASELDRAAHALRDTRTGNEYPLEPRLLDLAYRLQRHFNANALRVVSGYRTPTHGGRSNHGRGRAMDLVVPGATNDEVVRYARLFGFTGVGLYPKSGFVHLDSRDQSYFWVQTSWNRIASILGASAREADREARRRGEGPPARWAEPADSLELLPAPGPKTSPAPEPGEDGDDEEVAYPAAPETP